MSNYPDGAANDPRAPWNQPEMPEFEPSFEGECECCGMERCLNEDGECLQCFEDLQICEGA